MRSLYAVAGLAAIMYGSAARAQDSATHRVRLGIGAQVEPEYPGSDSSRVAPLIDVSVARVGEQFEFGAPDDSFDVSLIDTGAFSAGPALAITGKRKESDVEAPLGTIDRSIEIGAFAQVFTKKERFRLRAEVRQGIGGHEGLVGSVGADAVLRDEDRYDFSIGPRVLFSNARYQRAYFGVSGAAANLTDLGAYSPDGGIHALGVTSGFHYSLGNRWGIFGYGRYERLVGDAKNSPIVRELGSSNQLSGGLGISYLFNLKL
jgi:outer membrane protein